MTLPEFWFLLIAVLFTGYFVLEGFDFGVGMLLPVVGRSSIPDGDTRRRVLLSSIGPVWDGNEVWLLTAGGALFAAFGGWYASMFSAFYLPLFLILIGLIVRVVSIEWRGKIDDLRWRRWCDAGIGLGSWLPALLWGVAFANVVHGIKIDAHGDYVGSFFDLLNPYALLGGLTTLLAFLTHGAVFLALKTTGELRTEVVRLAARLAPVMALVAAAFLLWTQLAYGKGWTWILFGLAGAAAVLTVVATRAEKESRAFLATSVAIIGTVGMLFAVLFPNVLVSSLNPAYTLTIDGTSSSHYTLVIMTWAAAMMTPVVICYQGYSYWVFRSRISVAQIPASVGLTPRG
jgi:cytochrome d ubiquinol oxidase subunit II